MQKIGARRPRAQLQDQHRTEPVPRREGDQRRLGGERCGPGVPVWLLGRVQIGPPETEEGNRHGL